MTMPKLDGTKTHEHLKEAFAGESQANRRYLYFAKVADIEGYPEVAGLFKDTADGETGHAHSSAGARPEPASLLGRARFGAGAEANLSGLSGVPHVRHVLRLLSDPVRRHRPADRSGPSRGRGGGRERDDARRQRPLLAMQ